MRALGTTACSPTSAAGHVGRRWPWHPACEQRDGLLQPAQKCDISRVLRRVGPKHIVTGRAAVQCPPHDHRLEGRAVRSRTPVSGAFLVVVAAKESIHRIKRCTDVGLLEQRVGKHVGSLPQQRAVKASSGSREAQLLETALVRLADGYRAQCEPWRAVPYAMAAVAAMVAGLVAARRRRQPSRSRHLEAHTCAARELRAG